MGILDKANAKKKELKDEQKRLFAIEYVANGFNSLEAYKVMRNLSERDVSISQEALRTGGCRYARDPYVQSIVRELLQNNISNIIVTAETVMAELCEVAFQRRDILKGNYSEVNKLKALELMQKQLGVYTVNNKIEGKLSQEVVIISEDLDE